MSKIKLLSDSIISKIAAGEVVERPAYAVKELIENAIDAGADYIRIDIEKAGLQKISVTDNGEGMSREDIQLAFKRHTTSKIKDMGDLFRIHSMGFRGEALASIAAISNMTIQSKTKNQTAGTMVEVKAGELKNVSPVGIPVGTTVIVENLFYTVPARQKFLKSLQTEYRHIVQIITNAALAFPHIRFFFTNNKRTVFDLPPTRHPEQSEGSREELTYQREPSFEDPNTGSSFSTSFIRNDKLIQRIKTLLGTETFQHLIPLSFEHSYINISGFIAKPQLSTRSQQKQYIFVNNRPVKNKIISSAVKQSYGTLLEPQAYPIFILFIDIPHERVDVNVHPRKEEILFHDNDLISETIHQAVAETLAKHNLTFHDKRWKTYDSPLQNNFYVRDGSTQSYAAEILKDEVLPWEVEDITNIQPNADVIQIHNLYIVTQTKKGIFIIDQHAAHERILYEQFLQAFQKRKNLITQYELPKIITIDLSFTEAEIVKGHIEQLKNIGFDIEEFMNNTFKITAIPELFKDRNIKELILEMIDDLSQDKKIKDIDTRSHRMLTYLACRSAIKAGDNLTKQKMKELLEELQQTPNNSTCPHGRPTMIEITDKELKKLFRRI
jgi:DNA mismatch repair protein MutL